MTEAMEQQLDREFAVWLTRHNFPDDLPEHCLKPLRTAALLVSGYEADKTSSVSPAETNPPLHDQEGPSDHPKFPGTKVLTKEHLIRVMGEQKAAALFKQLNI